MNSLGSIRIEPGIGGEGRLDQTVTPHAHDAAKSRGVTAFALLMLGTLLFAMPAYAQRFSCDGSVVYGLVVDTGGGYSAINAYPASTIGSSAGPLAGTQRVSIPVPSANVNALAISPRGRFVAWVQPNVDGFGATRIFVLDTDNGDAITAVDSFDGVADVQAGAIDDRGVFYYARMSPDPAQWIFAADISTGTAVPFGHVASVTLARSNGDWAFDRENNLYIVNGGTTGSDVIRVVGPLPNAPVGVPQAVAQQIIVSGIAPLNWNSMALDGNGNFIGGTAGAATTIDPITGSFGVSTALVHPPTGNQMRDMASCATPDSLTVLKNLVVRQNPGDQITLRLQGGSNILTATTAGSATGLQPEAIGPLVVVSGSTYTVSEIAAGSTILANYTSTYACVDTANGNAPVATSGSGTGTNFTITLPATSNSRDIVCTFSNTMPLVDLMITKTNTPLSGPSDQSADTVTSGTQTTYTIGVTNNGPDDATGAVVRDTPVAGIDCPAANLVICSSPAAGACPSSALTIADLTAGIMLGTLPAAAGNNTATLTFSCNIQ